ncbi:peptide deformylase [Lactobacillus sp. ESL0785]|uniref:peptide deformylase n=1 Tax=Lactobacillus sp. ESL0785 TaxID=2983232 RepID=UPI0023F78F1E|nr:peptide deformylase [Lactobacillus sp. ESL0785]WEV70936.1 peptide deformylase [Lactobacillus sp. ESL0785]
MIREITKDVLFLSQKALPATEQDRQVAIDLRDTLVAKRNAAAGLAANMIGINKQIIAFYMGSLPIVMINPQIKEWSGTYSTKEGCLSLAGLRTTKRYQKILVEYWDINFKKQVQDFTGFTAETIQHELDHCSGILI